jgi:putative thioredoxin
MALISPSGKPLKSAPKPSDPASGSASIDGALIKDGTDASFMVDVIEASMQQPVLIDFWAPWCGPCRTLGPNIERAVTAARGKVKLVKINIDENPAYAGQLRVQSIPAVFVIDKGKPVDGFMGAVPESQIKALIDRVSGGQPDGIDELMSQAAESLGLGDLGGAAQSFASILQLDPENLKARAGLARVYLAGGQMEQAGQLLVGLSPEQEKDPDVTLVRTRIALAEAASGAGDPDEQAAKVARDPANHQARFDLAMAHVGAGDLESAVHELLTILKAERTWNDGAARTQLLDIFNAAGPNAELTKSGRRALSSILFA